MIHGQPRLVFVSLSDDMGSERIVAEMGRRGAVCALLARRDTVAAASRHVVSHHRLPSFGGVWAAAVALGPRLEGLTARWRPDVVIPLDDMTAGLLRSLAVRERTSGALRSLLVRSLGDPAHYATVCCRALLIESAQRLGVRTPRQHRAGNLAEAVTTARETGYPLMVKREATCGGFGVTLVRDEAALARAFDDAAAKARVKRALRGVAGLKSIRAAAPITLQAHVAGRLAMRTVACAEGRVVAGVSFVAERLDPPATGSSTVVHPIDNPEMEAAARRLAEALGLSGFVSFDFILAEDGAAYLIEMNARPIGSGHLGARFGHDLYGAWLRGFAGFRDVAPPDAPVPAGAVALFPKELNRDPASPDLEPGAGTFHDVPRDEPGVVAAYRGRLLRRNPAAASAIARHLPAAPGGDPVLIRRPGPERPWTFSDLIRIRN